MRSWDFGQSPESAEARYLDLIKRSVAGQLAAERYELHPGSFEAGGIAWLNRCIDTAVRAVGRLSGQELVTARRLPVTSGVEGGPWPAAGETMIGRRRLDSLQGCVEEVIDRSVPGDLIETGVWRGGATILIRAVLAAYGVTDRLVWAADSFGGMPTPDPGRYRADASSRLHRFGALSVPLEEVRGAFARYGLLDEQMQFLRGRFRDTLPTIRGRPWALLRLDGDLYESTIDALRNLYPSLSPGGYVIVDDYGALGGCRRAVDEFRRDHGIVEPIEEIDASAILWRRDAPGR